MMAKLIARSRHALWLAALCLVGPGAGFAEAQVTRVRPGPAAATARAEQPKKREAISPTDRLIRDFQTGERSGAFLGVLMHSLDRVLSGGGSRTEFDLAVEQALARNPGVSRASLAQMVASYKAVPAEVRARAMPRDLASLDRATGLSLDDAHRLASARPGTAVRIQGGAQVVGARVGAARATPTLRSETSAAPRIRAVGALALGRAERRIVLDGTFAGSSPIVPIYLRPAAGQSLEESGFQMVDEERVAVVLGRVNGSRSRIEGTLPVGLTPGRYDVAVRVPQGASEPKSAWYGFDLAPYAYTVRLLSIRCIDESNPESLPSGVPGVAVPVSDEVRVSWAAFADAGMAEVGLTSEYPGFDDGTERQLKMQPQDEGGIFMRPESGDARPGAVANRLFVVAQLWEVDGNDFSMMQDGRFMADIGRMSMDELDVQQFLERLSQALYWSMAQFRGSHEHLGEVRVSFSAGDLQDMTNNEAGRHRGEMRFQNSEAKGSYLVNYEIRRHTAPN